MFLRYLIISAILLSTPFFSTSAIADNNSDEFKFTSSFGLGSQYAGVVGAQFGIANQKHQLYGALGFLGVGAGYNYATSENIAVGVNAFFLVAAAGYGINANYYFGSTFSPGWMVGVDVFNSSAVLVGGGDDDIGAFISL